jgi:cytochrome c peroxidase
VGAGLLLSGTWIAVVITARMHKESFAPEAVPTYPAMPARLVFEAQLDTLGTALDRLLNAVSNPSANSRSAYRTARACYKRAETLLHAFGPTVASALNGPVPEDEDRPAGPLGAPAGFQIVESAVFGVGDSLGRDSLRATVRAMRDQVTGFRPFTVYLNIGDGALLDAARLELARVTTLSLAGFDSDLSRDGAVEAGSALEGLRALLGAGNPSPERAALDSLLAGAAAYLRAHPDFESLDRLEFITRFEEPASRLIALARRAAGDSVAHLRRLWRQDASSVFDPGAFDASAYAPDFAPSSSPGLVALGRRLFNEPRLSGPGTRACSFCHDPARAFTDGRSLPALLDSSLTPHRRNTPTLVNAGLQPALFFDSRVGSLEAQAEAVLASPAEMGGNAEMAAQRLRQDSTYRNAFAAALHLPSDRAVTGRAIRVALGAYVRSLEALNSRFDRALRGDSSALTPSERKGFTVFMGKGRCATCHFLPLLNGTMPPDFASSEPEIIGVPDRVVTHGARLDSDPGRAGFDHEETHQAAFKVPTLRNVALTAPYMHNGVFTTLEQVIDFYDRGGGAGIGAGVPGQTLPNRRLHLTPGEKRDLIAFLGALTDTVASHPAAVRQVVEVRR